jgi:hypothetical protein
LCTFDQSKSYYMKKILLLLCCSFGVSAAFAQMPGFGIKGGVNFASLNASNGNLSLNTGTTTTFAVGVFADFKLGAVSIQPAVNYTGKGGNINDGDGNMVDIKTYYVQVPVNVVYHFPAGIGNAFVGAGPFVGVGLSGKATAKSGGTSISDDINFGDGPEDFKRTEFGLNGIAGIEFDGGFLIGINYDLGLSDITNDNGDSGALKNRVFGISVGYKF